MEARAGDSRWTGLQRCGHLPIRRGPPTGKGPRDSAAESTGWPKVSLLLSVQSVLKRTDHLIITVELMIRTEVTGDQLHFFVRTKLPRHLRQAPAVGKQSADV